MDTDQPDVVAWRADKRRGLLARREAIPADELRRLDERVGAFVEAGFARVIEGLVLGFYWPMRGEFDPRVTAHRMRTRGTRTALPVVVRKAAPLQFREWRPDVETRPGVFGLPVPQGTAVLTPDVVLAPPVGFDEAGYRLGYGGGYFDRTLASLLPQPLTIAVAREASRMPTIHPQAYDVPMDFVVTEAGVHEVAAGRMRLIERPEEVARRAREIIERRRMLPAAEVAALLNTLLEGERAGAKVLAAFLDQLALSGEDRALLADLQRDESRNCAVLMNLLRGMEAPVSDATGDFLRKALEVEGTRERLVFLNRGQEWVARSIAQALPRIGPGEVREALLRMHDSHVANVAGCNRLIERMEPAAARG